VELDALIYNVEQIALGALGSYASSFAAVPYDAPPQALRAAIEESRLAMRAGKRDVAFARMDQALADPVLRYQLSEYREALTFAEKENARKLSSAAWAYHTLLPRALEGDLALMAQLEDMREFVLREYGVEALITERGWAEKQTEQRTLLPSVWRHV
jgi:hypothetical protein